jgi:hypothetical protein
LGIAASLRQVSPRKAWEGASRCRSQTPTGQSLACSQHANEIETRFSLSDRENSGRNRPNPFFILSDSTSNKVQISIVHLVVLRFRARRSDPRPRNRFLLEAFTPLSLVRASTKIRTTNLGRDAFIGDDFSYLQSNLVLSCTDVVEDGKVF